MELFYGGFVFGCLFASPVSPDFAWTGEKMT